MSVASPIGRDPGRRLTLGVAIAANFDLALVHPFDIEHGADCLQEIGGEERELYKHHGHPGVRQ